MNDIKVKNIIDLCRQFAPEDLAYTWDNVGLQLGQTGKKVKRVLLTVDITKKVADFAIENRTDLIVTHHPMIFKPLRSVTDELIIELIKNDVAVYCMHTNLDLVKGGVNYSLAERLGLRDLEPLSCESGSELYHIACYVPEESVDRITKAVVKEGAGLIGNYAGCMNSYKVKGQFMPLQGSTPCSGKINEQENLEEVKIEFFSDSSCLDGVIEAIKKNHPYETPVYVVYVLQQSNLNFSLGLVGKLPSKMRLRELAEKIKTSLHLPSLDLWTAGFPLDSEISSLAVCGGSGSSLLKKAEKAADAYLTGDIKYHDYLVYRKPLFMANHFYTEYPVLLKLRDIIGSLKLDVSIMPLHKHDVTNLVTV